MSFNPLILQVLVGTEFDVLCQTDSFYEFCIFVSPIGQRCEFEWRRKVCSCFFVFSVQYNYLHPFLQKWNISRSDCLELELRTSFVGTYNEHQCGIRVRNARPSDSGIWGCEMESYKFGGGRGSGFIVRGGVEVCGIPFYGLIMPLPSKNTRTVEQGQGSICIVISTSRVEQTYVIPRCWLVNQLQQQRQQHHDQRELLFGRALCILLTGM